MATNPPNNNTTNQTQDQLKKSLRETTSLQTNLADAADEFTAINEAAKLSGKEIDNIVSLSTQLNNLFKETLTLQSKIGKEYIKISSVQREIFRYTEQSEKLNEHIKVHVAILGNKYKLIEQQVDKAESKYIRISELTKEISSGTLNQIDLQKKLTQLLIHKQQLEKLLQDADVRKVAYLKFQKHLADETATSLTNQLDTIEELNKKIDLQNQKLGSLGALMKGISRIPILGNLIQTQKVLDAMENKLEKTGSKWKAFGAGISATLSEIGRIFTSPLVLAGILLGIVMQLVKASFELDKNITASANSIGITKEATQAIYKNFENITIHSTRLNENLNNSLLSISNQGKALNELNSSFGTSIVYTERQIQDQIFLTKQMGMAAEEAKLIMQFGVLTNTNANDTLKTIIKQNNSVISYRKVISEVARISGQLVAQYKNSPELLAKAVVEANKLGISLEQAKKQSESLLNFQGSIEAEMEAELITGKQLNLERARGLALAGESASAAKEMLAQVGSFNQYSKLNVIQQESLAKAVGMTANELTNALREQETRYRLYKTDRDSLYAARINPITRFTNSGVVIYGQKTMQVAETALNRINVRRLLINLKRFVTDSCRSFVFEQNTNATRLKLANIVNPYMDDVKAKLGLYAYRVVVDNSNNTSDVIDRNELQVKIFLSPTKTIEFILLEFNISPTQILNK